MTGLSDRGRARPAGGRAGLPREVVLVWLLLGLVAVAIAVTYARLPARELYHVSGSGPGAGASRVLVFLNFPTALVALAVLALLFERLAGRVQRAAAVLAAVLCCAVFWPGAVDPANLDAKPVNALAALGVALALLLSLDAARRLGCSQQRRQRGDRLRVVVAAIVVLLGVPWFAAELGFFLDGVPLFGSVYETGAYPRRPPALAERLPTVHLGHHHGMDGVLLILSALLLSRLLGHVQVRRLRSTLAAYLSLLFCYGVANLATDFWVEQIFKRGWSAWRIPDVLEPRASIAWAVVAGATVVLWLVWRWRLRDP